LSNSEVYQSQIETLYLDTFSKGDAAQHFDLSMLRHYLNATLKQGHALMCFDQNKLIACLLYASLSFDTECPKQILDRFVPTQCAYITELMVDVSYRGLGLGRKLMVSFFDLLNKQQYADVFIRVWDKNLVAIQLYKSVGFELVSSIEQVKTHVDSSSHFSMTKLYLHKAL